MLKPIFIKIIALLSLIFLAACSSSQSTPSGPVTVKINATDFAFESSMTTFQVGVPYRFEVTNNGKVPHEFMLVKPIEAGAMEMEEMDAMALAHIEEDDLEPGSTQSVEYTFTQAYPAGQLEFSCHLPGHYEAGMVLPITVK